MSTVRIALAAGCLLAATFAQGQLPESPAPTRLERNKPVLSSAFTRSPGPFTYLYNAANEGATAFDTVFGSYHTDPKLVFGIQLSPRFALETGYANLLSEGVHFVDYGRADERAGALGTKGFSSYVAGKLTLPLNEQLSAYGKLGAARSERITHDRAGLRVTNFDAGPYANVGARYKLNERATISGELTRVGDTANQWGGSSNSTEASANLKVGF